MLFAELILAREPVQYIDKSWPSPNCAFTWSSNFNDFADLSQVTLELPAPTNVTSSLNVDIPVTERLPIPAFEVTVRSFVIVTLSGSPIVTELAVPTVVISFAVPASSSSSLSKSIERANSKF